MNAFYGKNTSPHGQYLIKMISLFDILLGGLGSSRMCHVSVGRWALTSIDDWRQNVVKPAFSKQNKKESY